MDAHEKEPARLGCCAHELDVGIEFSMDQGCTWLVVRTEPAYCTPGNSDTVLRFMASPKESTGLSEWQEVKLDDWEHVLLEREWPNTKKES